MEDKGETATTDSSVPNRTRDRAISGSVLIAGIVIVTFLTCYNLRGYTVWSTGPGRPFRTFEEYLVVNMTGLIFVPFLLLFAGFRHRAEEYGFCPPQPGIGRLTLLLFAAMLPVLFVASRFPDFQLTYPLQKQAAYSWGYFLYFELAYGLYLFCWEFFYRGILTFGLRRGFGDAAAITLQALAFGIMHYGKPTPELISSFFGGAILGWLAIRARSFFPGFLLHWSIAFTLDCLAIHAKSGGIF